jgi:hypothetical protein
MTRYVLAWFPMLALAIANGALRQLTFGKYLSELHAHQLSTVTGSVILGVFIWIVIRFWPPVSSRQAVSIGLLWVMLTIAFESGMGRMVMHRPWSQLFHDYNLAAGRVWPLLLIWIAVAPSIFYQLRSRSLQLRQ